jgi:hypothetical protein
MKPQITPTSYSETQLVTVVDSVSSSLTYIGKAKRGSISSDKAWRIKRITKILTQTFIEISGDGFTKAWDDRYTITYS